MDIIEESDRKSDLKSLLSKVHVQPLLYQHMPYNFFAEQLFNASLSTIYPHCAICVLMAKYELRPDWVDALEAIPPVSPVLIPEGTFRYGQKDLGINLFEKFDSPIVVCSKCKVAVHTSKYLKGVFYSRFVLRLFRCSFN